MCDTIIWMLKLLDIYLKVPLVSFSETVVKSWKTRPGLDVRPYQICRTQDLYIQESWQNNSFSQGWNEEEEEGLDL